MATPDWNTRVEDDTWAGRNPAKANTVGWVVFVAMLGMTSTLLGTEISAFQNWDAAFTPGFVGKALVHFGSVIGAFLGGKLIPS